VVSAFPSFHDTALPEPLGRSGTVYGMGGSITRDPLLPFASSESRLRFHAESIGNRADRYVGSSSP